MLCARPERAATNRLRLRRPRGGKKRLRTIEICKLFKRAERARPLQLRVLVSLEQFVLREGREKSKPAPLKKAQGCGTQTR